MWKFVDAAEVFNEGFHSFESTYTLVIVGIFYRVGLCLELINKTFVKAYY